MRFMKKRIEDFLFFFFFFFFPPRFRQGKKYPQTGRTIFGICLLIPIYTRINRINCFSAYHVGAMRT
jgi:hypothetical protein